MVPKKVDIGEGHQYKCTSFGLEATLQSIRKYSWWWHNPISPQELQMDSRKFYRYAIEYRYGVVVNSWSAKPGVKDLHRFYLKEPNNWDGVILVAPMCKGTIGMYVTKRRLRTVMIW